MASPSLIWGVGLGIADGTFFALMREGYDAWNKMQRPNATKDSTSKFWLALGAGAGVGGIVMPLMYIWAAYSLGSLIEIHIYRSIFSVVFSILFGSFMFKDTLNGYRALGVLFSLLGLVLVLGSTAWGKDTISNLNA